MEDRFQRVLREWSTTEKCSLFYGGNRIIILPYLPETIFMENKQNQDHLQGKARTKAV